ncbi:DedA family protein [archaeon]|jgi:membrane protein DedA with SNARE-associated domain|nr:DedA family protein [archaeon]MBT4242188.1 DedA family protein [archaeon]MBT4417876.1 DedA family protein [archaeon]
MIETIFNLLHQLIEFLVTIISSLGYLGIFIGMTIESSFLPFPSELILPPAGVLISRGEMSWILVLISAVLGSILGALINYFLALTLGRRAINHLLSKYEKILFFLDEDKLAKSDYFFKKHGEITTFIGRLVPGIRQLISIPAGFAKMNLKRFIFFTTLGAGIWSFILIYLGYLYGDNIDVIKQNANTILLFLLPVILLSILIYLLMHKKKKDKQSIKEKQSN